MGGSIRRAALRHLSHRLRAPVRRLLFPGQLLDAAEPLPARCARPARSKCAAPARALLSPEPRRAAWSRPSAARTNQPYTAASRRAFRYRKEYVQRLLVQDHRVCSRGGSSAAVWRSRELGCAGISFAPGFVATAPQNQSDSAAGSARRKRGRSRYPGSSAKHFPILNSGRVEFSRACLQDAHAHARVRSEAAAT